MVENVLHTSADEIKFVQSGFEKPCSHQLHWVLMPGWLVDLLEPIHTPCSEPAEAMEIRVAIQASDVRAEGERVTAAFKQWVDAGQRMRSCDKLGVNFGFVGACRSVVGLHLHLLKAAGRAVCCRVSCGQLRLRRAACRCRHCAQTCMCYLLAG